MTFSSPHVAVLTGDLLRSTQAGPVATDKAISRIEAFAATCATWPGNGADHFTRFRGDGWQFVIPRAAYALRAVISTHAVLRSDTALPLTRIAIGIGPLDTLPDGGLSAASGSALVASGQGLDGLERSRMFTIAGEGVTPLHRAVLSLAEDQARRWTAEQAEAVALYLSPRNPTQKSIADSLHISTQALHARLKGAGAQPLRRAVEDWERHEDHHD